MDKNIPYVRQAFEQLGDVSMVETTQLTNGAVRDADALIVRSETRVGEELLGGSRVTFVGTATIGIDHVDTGFLQSRGIAFASAPGCNSNSVKEYFVAALLHLSRVHGMQFHGKTMGVVGVGHVGGKVAEVSRALGLDVLENDPPLARLSGEKRFIPLDDLMDCDLISLHVPLTRGGTDPTYHLFDRDRFRRLKPGVVFINTSRGGVADTEALKKAILERRISHSVLDVWENEPAIDPELLSMSTLGTPHIAGYSLEGKINGLVMVRAAACDHFSLHSHWDPYRQADLPAMNDVEIPAGTLRLEEMLDHVVKQCYDISLDDAALRLLLNDPPDERSRSFSHLRSNYRVRREFSNYAVSLPRKHGRLKDTLAGIGFTNFTIE